MFDPGPEILTVMMLVGIMVGIFVGFHVGIVLGALALIFGYLEWGAKVGEVLYPRVFDMMLSYILLAVPLFIFMGLILERSGITERMYDALHLWLGGFRGGLAIITVLIGTIMAACVGIIAASITMLAVVALRAMIRRGYNKGLAAGSVCAGGCLGILIPPSIMLVIYGPMAGISVGKLFMAAFIPGFTLSGLYISYIAIRSFLQPKVAPAVPIEERAVPFLKKTGMLITSMVPPLILVLSVLGVIFMGIAPPTQAAGVGALVATFFCVAYRQFSWQGLAEAALITLKYCGFIMLIASMAFAFVAVFLGSGCGSVVEEWLLAIPAGKWGVFAAIMFTIFILGMLMDWIPIAFIMVPIVSPLIPVLGFDPLWFALMVCVNFQTGYMTPPFAAGIFILKGASPPDLELTIGDIIRGVIPFVFLILVALALFVAFPQIILWLPGQMIR